MWNYIIFGVILLHLVVGFGWLFWKLEMQKGKSEDNEDSKIEESEDKKAL